MNWPRLLTWHVHGSYLYYLSQARFEVFVPVDSKRSPGYAGRSGPFPWGKNLHEVPLEEVANLSVDAVLYQSKEHYVQDRNSLLSEAQRQLPVLYIEHDPPREHPTDTKHILDDPTALLVHVTHFNNLMWDSNQTPTQVIEHGVTVPEEVVYTGELARGIVVINNLAIRGRRLGRDIFERVRQEVPVDLIGIGSEELGGLGEVPHNELPAFIAQYRFFFNPIRYTSLGLSVLEAMAIGQPVVGLATTEMATTIENGVNGYVGTDISGVVGAMRSLLDNPQEAQRLGVGARRTVQERFSIARFVRDWEEVVAGVITHKNNLPVETGRY